MEQKATYIYYWDRIIGALIALVLLICLVAYGVYSLVATENLPEPSLSAPNKQEPPTDNSSPPSKVITSGLTDQKTLTRLADAPDKDESQQHFTVGSAPLSPRVSVPENSPTTEAGSDALPVDAGTGLVHEQAALEVSIPAAGESSMTEKAQPGQQATPDLTEEKPEPNESNKVTFPQHSATGRTFQLQEIKTISPSVKRFILARSIVAREPVGSVDSITTDTKGVAAIYAFSEVVDMSDLTLYYHWLNNEQQVAKVRVGVRTDRWRSYSSKYFSNGMNGAWSVELRTQDGLILASANFLVGAIVVK